MFPNLFSASPAIWAGLIGMMVALPVLIHLINMLRHRRVKWAAMDFLLQSYKRQRNWVRLKQLLLLLARITALLLALLMLAQAGCQDPRLAGILGGQTTHHYIIVDDSYSMGETQAGASALDRARETIGTIGARLGRKENQRVTLLRYSQAATQDQAKDSNLAIEQLTDINGQRVDSQFGELLEERRNTLQATTLATGAADALDVTRQLIEQNEGEIPVVYLLSDFRNQEWDRPTQLLPILVGLSEAEASLQFIRCATAPQGNLGVGQLQPVGSIRSAGVPIMMSVEVQNFSTEPVRNVTLRCFTQPFSAVDEATGQPGEVAEESELPAIFIEQIPAGKTETREFPVFFSSPGRHGIRVQLPDDVLTTDNERWTILNVDQAAQVLIIEAGETAGAFYLSSAFRPGRASSGVVPVIKTADELRDMDPNDLASMAAVYMNGVPSLDPVTVEKLQRYVESGGGLAVFINQDTNLASFNQQFYQGGEGLSPLPLARLEDLPLDPEGVPDVVAAEHPLLEPFRDSNDSFLNLIQIRRFAVPPLEWNPSDSLAEIAAYVRGDPAWPLIVEKRFGEGRVAVITTSADTAWNNWQRNPSFLVMLLRLQERLASGLARGEERLVGQPLLLELPHDQFRAEVSFETPTESRDLLDLVERSAIRAGSSDNAPWLTGIGPTSPEGGQWTATAIPGLYTAWTRTVSGENQTFRWALNVDPIEGDLALMGRRTLVERTDSVGANVIDWNELNPNPQREASTQLSRWLLPLLILLLVGEQILAYAASYHPLRTGVKA
jgi:uncharacterized membrane protein